MMLSCYSNQANASKLDTTLQEKIMMLAVTASEQEFELETTFFIPPGDGPFPVLVMNHGKERGNPKR